jgi:hypothetical protein
MKMKVPKHPLNKKYFAFLTIKVDITASHIGEAQHCLKETIDMLGFEMAGFNGGHAYHCKTRKATTKGLSQ